MPCSQADDDGSRLIVVISTPTLAFLSSKFNGLASPHAEAQRCLDVMCRVWEASRSGLTDLHVALWDESLRYLQRNAIVFPNMESVISQLEFIPKVTVDDSTLENAEAIDDEEADRSDFHALQQLNSGQDQFFLLDAMPQLAKHRANGLLSDDRIVSHQQVEQWLTGERRAIAGPMSQDGSHSTKEISEGDSSVANVSQQEDLQTALNQLFLQRALSSADVIQGWALAVAIIATVLISLGVSRGQAKALDLRIDVPGLSPGVMFEWMRLSQQISDAVLAAIEGAEYHFEGLTPLDLQLTSPAKSPSEDELELSSPISEGLAALLNLPALLALQNRSGTASVTLAALAEAGLEPQGSAELEASAIEAELAEISGLFSSAFGRAIASFLPESAKAPRGVGETLGDLETGTQNSEPEAEERDRQGDDTQESNTEERTPTASPTRARQALPPLREPTTISGSNGPVLGVAGGIIAPLNPGVVSIAQRSVAGLNVAAIALPAVALGNPGHEILPEEEPIDPLNLVAFTSKSGFISENSSIPGGAVPLPSVSPELAPEADDSLIGVSDSDGSNREPLEDALNSGGQAPSSPDPAAGSGTIEIEVDTPSQLPASSPEPLEAGVSSMGDVEAIIGVPSENESIGEQADSAPMLDGEASGENISGSDASGSGSSGDGPNHSALVESTSSGEGSGTQDPSSENPVINELGSEFLDIENPVSENPVINNLVINNPMTTDGSAIDDSDGGDSDDGISNDDSVARDGDLEPSSPIEIDISVGIPIIDEINTPDINELNRDDSETENPIINDSNIEEPGVDDGGTDAEGIGDEVISDEVIDERLTDDSVDESSESGESITELPVVEPPLGELPGEPEPAYIDLSGGQHTIDISENESPETDAGPWIIHNFGGIGTGTQPESELVAEADTLRFTGDNLIPENLRLTQVESDLRITFDRAPEVEIWLADFALENLDNLTQATTAIVDFANLIFDGETGIFDSIDVFNADWQRGRVLNPNTVTFLNDLDNRTAGFESSDDTIHGQGGSDVLTGLSGNDYLLGGEGDDQLFGGTGHNRLEGGAGRDGFYLHANGYALITDLTLGEDTVYLPTGVNLDEISIVTTTVGTASQPVTEIVYQDNAIAGFNGQLTESQIFSVLSTS